MNRIYIAILFCPILFFCKVNAQKTILTGQVLDSLQNPLELANVIALGEQGNIASYGITDAKGRFRLHLKKDTTYLLRVSYLGYEPWEDEYKALDDIEKRIVLKSSTKFLEGVTVTEDFPITISGDTITYKTDVFTNGKEKKLEDVLEQLPGFEVDEDGRVKVQGTDIQKVLVEGKEFFDGDTKMATKNIPASAVDKVQVLRDYNEVGPLSNVNNSEALALNIKLKDGQKNIWFGDVTSGGGPEDRYLLHPNLFYYSPKLSLNIIGDLNNIGEQSFTLQDYFRFNGGLSGMLKKSGSSVRLSNDDLGLSILQNDRAYNIISKMAALNFNYNPNKKMSLSGFGILTGVATDLINRSQRTYITQGGTNEEQLASNILQENTGTLLKLSSTYTPNVDWHLDYDLFLKASNISDRNQLNSSFIDFSNIITSTRTNAPFSLKQALNIFYAKNEKNVFSLESNHTYKEGLPNMALSAEQLPLANILPIEGESPFELFQDKKVYTNTYDAQFNYYHVLNDTNHFNVTAGMSLNRQNLRSQLSQRLNNAEEDIGEGNDYINNTNYNFSDYYAGLGYRVKWGKLTISPSLNVHFYDVAIAQFEAKVGFDKVLLLPSLNSSYKIDSAKSLRLRYAIEAEFPGIQNLTAARELSGYNGVFTGNPELQNAWYHKASLNFTNFNMFNFTTIYGGLTYQKRYDAIGSSIDFFGFDRLSSLVNLTNPNKIFSGFATYEKRLPNLKAKLETRISYNKLNTIINGENNFNRSFSQTYKLELDTRFEKAPNVGVGFEKIWNDYAGLAVENRFVTNSPFANIEAYFLKFFSFTADYQYNEYKNVDGGSKTSFDFLNAALYFKKEDSNWEFKISGLNVLNTRSIRQDAFSNNLISTQEYAVQPRYFLASIKYEL